jgi:phytoene synthase
MASKTPMALDTLMRGAQATTHPSVEASLRWCRRYTRERAKNFYYAFAILPEEKRQAIYATYAFSGYVDDIVDEAGEPAAQLAALNDARRRLHTTRAGNGEGPLFTALGWTFERFNVPEEFFDELINGCEMDLTQVRYETWADLHQYCYRVASMIGLMCTSVFGTKSHPQARQFAIDLGIGLQVVNIMRDVKEDAARGRIYFPQTELAQFGLTDQDILDGVYDERFIALMKHQGKRARRHFRSGRRLLPLLDTRSRMCVNVLQGVYFEILKRIERERYDVYSNRISLSGREKLWSIAKLWTDAALVRRK